MKNETFLKSLEIPFADEIKNQLLAVDVKSECCKNSFVCGVTVFERSRKNKYYDRIQEYIHKQRPKKKKQFFENLSPMGYQADEENGERFPKALMPCPHCASHLIRGAFLVCGRSSLTEKGVSMELVMPGEKSAEIVCEILSGIDINLKSTVRRGEHLLYTKKSQEIEDCLSYIGAVNASFYVMNSKIEKELIMNASRLTNCDANNLVKVADAAARQNEAIRAIMKNGAMDKLSPALKETARIRYENPFESLEMITELHGGALSKSGVNHRLQKIVAFAVKNGYLS